MKHSTTIATFALVTAFGLAACSSKHSPTRPGYGMDRTALSPSLGKPADPGPGYEKAYYDGETFTINAVEVRQNPTQQAHREFYEVVYPRGFEDLGTGTPQCDPCDHDGNGVDFTDFHDHVLTAVPSEDGHGAFTPLWHVFVVLPAYNGDAAHDAEVGALYASRLPVTSDDGVDDLLDETLPDGSPLAVETDTHFYFLCAVVDPHAAH